MTQIETRKLGIEFERRLQEMYPNSKHLEKLTSNTIYSILNEYQIKYVKQLYAAQRQQKLGEFGAENIDNVLGMLYSTSQRDVQNDTFDLPENYWLYLSSTSNADVRYNVDAADTGVILSNQLIENKDVNDVIPKYTNYAGIIRNPLVLIQDDKCRVIHDVYTTINSVDLAYYRMPNKFDVTTNCELPLSAFDDIVSGAIKLYVFEYKFALALSASNSKYNKLKKGVDKLAEDNKQEQQ